MQARVLVSDAIAQEGIDMLAKGASVDVKIGISKDELVAVIGEYDALAVRSETKVTADVIAAANRLKIIGRAGVGVDNIDVAKATERGILVVNSPDGNTIAAAELTVAMLLALVRNIPQADAALRRGEWKRSKYVGLEVYKKSAGIVGLGKIGREVAHRLQAFGMNILAYDPYLTADQAQSLGVRSVDLDTLCRESDFISLHTPKTKETTGLINAERIAKMKPGVRLVNVARGGLIDEGALADALKSGHVAGAAIDVFSTEPAPADNPLIGLPNIVHTPHLGASTEEAQINVAVDIAEQILEVLAGQPARAAVNMPSVSPEVLAKIQPYLTLAEKIGSLQTQLTSRNTTKVEVIYSGDFADMPTVHLTRAVLKGLLEPIIPESVNFVNSPGLAQKRGIQVMESRRPEMSDHACLLTVRAGDDERQREICGTVYGKDDVRIVHIEGYRVDIAPKGAMLMTKHTDRPGIVGKIGTLLGDNGINIGGMNVGREGVGRLALMVLMIDDAISEELLAEIVKIDGMETARQVQL